MRRRMRSDMPAIKAEQAFGPVIKAVASHKTAS